MSTLRDKTFSTNDTYLYIDNEGHSIEIISKLDFFELQNKILELEKNNLIIPSKI
jgi:hypothetical protein